jgi:hypothetical protein
MILQFFFRHLSPEKQVLYLKKKGIALGTRVKNGRKIYLYMLSNLFVEVVYNHDNADETPERLNLLNGLKSLNQYLEREFKASF